MTTIAAMAWIIALLVGAVVLVVVAGLLHSVARPIRESRGYAREIETAMSNASANLEGLGRMRLTQQLLAELHAHVRRTQEGGR